VFSDGKGEKGICEPCKPIPPSWVNKGSSVGSGMPERRDGITEQPLPCPELGGRWQGPPAPAERAAPLSPARRAQGSTKLWWDLTERSQGHQWDQLAGPPAWAVPGGGGGRAGTAAASCWERNGVGSSDRPPKHAAGRPGMDGADGSPRVPTLCLGRRRSHPSTQHLYKPASSPPAPPQGEPDQQTA